MTIGKNRMWNRRWCILNGYNINVYNYPSDEDYNNPIDVINLKNILYPYIVPANRTICSRSRTLLLHVGKERKRFEYYMSADTKEDLNKFKEIVDDVVTLIKNWKLQTYSDEIKD